MGNASFARSLIFEKVLAIPAKSASLRMPFVDVRYKGFSIVMYVRKIDLTTEKPGHDLFFRIDHWNDGVWFGVTSKGYFHITVQMLLVRSVVHFYDFASRAKLTSLVYWNELIVIGPRGIMEGMQNTKDPFRIYLNGKEYGYRSRITKWYQMGSQLPMIILGHSKHHQLRMSSIVWIANIMILSSNVRDKDIKKQTGNFSNVHSAMFAVDSCKKSLNVKSEVLAQPSQLLD